MPPLHYPPILTLRLSQTIYRPLELWSLHRKGSWEQRIFKKSNKVTKYIFIYLLIERYIKIRKKKKLSHLLMKKYSPTATEQTDDEGYTQS